MYVSLFARTDLTVRIFLNTQRVLNGIINNRLAALLLVTGVALAALAGCSTTKYLPEGEMLYTGIKEIEIADPDRSRSGEAALQEVEGALAYPPNNALFGSSSRRLPFPVGLWIYGGFGKYEKGVGRWIFDKFASEPTLINTVNPGVRAAVSRNILRENGYFDAQTGYEIVPDAKDSLKAQLLYKIQMNHAYTYDSIRYMRMRHFADTLIALHEDEKLLKKGEQFNVIALESERQRISSLLRDNGFYYYRPEYVVYEADTLAAPGKVWLRIGRSPNTPFNALRPYRIGNISVYLNGYNYEQPDDSIHYKDMAIYYSGKLRIRPAVLYNRFRFQPDSLYTQSEQQRTQTALSRLNVFRYAEFRYTPRDSSARSRSNVLDVDVNTIYDLPYDAEFEVNTTTKSNDYAGPGAVFSLTRRNAFYGGELLGIQLSGSYEWQTRNKHEGGRMNSYELGVSSTLTMPFLLFPGYVYRDLEQPSSTTFRISADLLNRARFFRMTSFSGSMTYDFRPTPVTRHSVTPFRLSYNKLDPTRFFRDSIAEQNRGLYLSLQDQFIPAMSYTFTYDNTPVAGRHYFSWSASVTQAGNLTGGIYALAGRSFNEKNKTLFGNRFAQFIKGTTEVRYNRRLDRNNRIAARFMAGAIYSYGNASVSPYNEQFYIGGANSVRAFAIRSIGPGRYVSPLNPDGTVNRYAYIDRTGDIKMEANLEYRFRIIGDLHGAVFMDTGGIWLMRGDNDRPGGTVKASEFFNDLALGTGAGIRYDMSFIVVRLDAGLALHVPYETARAGYFNMNPFEKGGYSWHLAIGYPF